MPTKDEYVLIMHTKLDHLNAEIDKLVLKADQAKDEAGVEYQSRLRRYVQRRGMYDSCVNVYEDCQTGYQL